MHVHSTAQLQPQQQQTDTAAAVRAGNGWSGHSSGLLARVCKADSEQPAEAMGMPVAAATERPARFALLAAAKA